MLIRDLAAALEAIAPLEYAQPWDRVGLLAGDSAAPLKGEVLLTIDLTEAVLEEAFRLHAGAIIAYHPPIFEPLARVTDASPRQRIILRALQHGVAIYSPHTALDACPGGVTDWLCEGLSGAEPGKVLGDVRALESHARNPITQQIKVVTFVPEADAERVRDALASAGAGIIGAYTRCSFTSSGLGTFRGDESSRPAVGKPERMERVPEVRLEMVCSKAALALAVETLRRFHPYESPAVDVYELLPVPTRNIGAGRRLQLDQPSSVHALAERLKAFLRQPRIWYAANDPHRPVSRLGVVPGSGGELSRAARDAGCEVFITGEMKHHDVLGALNAGMSVILGGHTATERGYLSRLADRLRTAGVLARVSEMDREVLVSV